MKKVLIFFLMLLPSIVLAEDNFSLTISDQFISSLSGSRLARSSGSTLTLPTRKGSKAISLSPVEIRSNNYESYITTSKGRVKDETVVSLYQGSVSAGSGNNFEFYRFALVNDGKSKPYLDGYFFTDGSYYSLKRENTGAEYLIKSLTEQDFSKLAAACGMPHQHQATSKTTSLRTTAQAGISALKVLEVATDADYEYFSQEGGSANANAMILSILNGVDAIYRAQLNISISVVFQNVWTTTSDPYSYSTPIHLLNEFMTYWQNNFSNRNFDVAHLFTGKDLDGGVVGIAFLSAVCGSFKFGLSQRLDTAAYDVALTAHEIGHNLGSDHDSCNGEQFLMCPTLVPYANTFSSNSVSSISQVVSNVSCLSGGGSNPTPTPTPTPQPGNNAPQLFSIGPKTIREGQSLSFNIGASDSDGDALSYSVTSNQFGQLSGTTYNFFAPIGTVPNGSSSQRYNLTFSVSDGLLSDSETIQITVTKAPLPNQPPVFNNPGTLEYLEGQVIKLRLSASDPEGGAVRFSVSSNLPAGASFDSSQGLLSWRPLGNQSGSYTFNVELRDLGGLSVSDSFDILINDQEGVAEMPTRHSHGDFDGDGRAELAVYRNFSSDWFTKNYNSSDYNSKQFGLSGDLPVPGDYNGDRITDFAVYRPRTNTWYIITSGDELFIEIPFGSTGDLPVGGSDYDGDGRDDLGIFRPAIGSFVYRGVFGQEQYLNIGQRGDVPMPCDYNGDGRDEFAVYRPSRGLWISSLEGINTQFAMGKNNDIPLAGDVNGDGRCDRFLYRNGQWLSEAGVYEIFGTGSDIPQLADYDGDGNDDLGLWRARQATWHIDINSWFPIQFGLFRDNSALEVSKLYAMKNTVKSGIVGRGAGLERAFVYQSRAKKLYSLYAGGVTSRSLNAVKGSYVFRGDYDGDTQLDLVYYNKGAWTVVLASGLTRRFTWGQSGDLPVAGDFDGDAVYDAAIYRNGEWHTISSVTGELVIYNVGKAGDLPIPADYNGDGRTDPAVINRSTMVWEAVDARSNSALTYTQWGLAGDVPVVADFDLDGRADLAAYRPANGTWYIRMSGGNELFIKWGKAGDVPLAGSFLSASAIDIAIFRPSSGQVIVRGLNGQTAVYTSSSARRGLLVDRSMQLAIQ